MRKGICVVLLAGLLTGCSQSSVTRSEGGVIMAVIKGVSAQAVTSAIAPVQEAMEEACEPDQLRLPAAQDVGPKSTGEIESAAKVLEALLKVFGLLARSHTVILEGHCVAK